MAALRISLAFVLLLAASPAAALAQAPGAAQGRPVSNEPFIAIPNVELGELYKDDDWGFEFRLPKDMTPLDPEAMEQMRAKNRPKPEDITSPEGVVAKVQFYQFTVPGTTANIFLRIHEPPVVVESASSLRQKINELELSKGLPVENRGKLNRFKFRGNRIGLLTSRDYGLVRGQDPTVRQTTAYLRGNTRSCIAQYTAAIAEFDQYEQEFLACLATFVVHEGEPMTANEIAPPRESPGLFSPSVLGSIALLVGLLAVLVLVVKKGN